MFSGGTVGLTTPRLGFRGSEDLGGGLKANFQLEQRIDIDTGAQQPTKANGVDVPGFKAASTLGLSGSFGQIRAGRMLAVYDNARALSNSRNVFDSNGFTPTGGEIKTIAKTKNADDTSPFNNQLRYDLPAMGGIRGPRLRATQAKTTPWWASCGLQGRLWTLWLTEDKTKQITVAGSTTWA